jgi:glutamate-ammonia-ligase adenylyltransferase
MAHLVQSPLHPPTPTAPRRRPSRQLEPFGHALTELAEVTLDEALRLCRDDLARSVGCPRLKDGRRCRFAICGLGKFGGRELGYASDIEMLFAYEDAGQTDGRTILQNREYFERLCQAVLGTIEAKQEGIFHLDVRLRPHGSQGLLASSVEEMGGYYHDAGLAASFERQALTKLRWVAGDSSLGRRIERLRDDFVYSGLPWDVTGALALRQRQMEELAPPGAVNVKYSPGGLIDIEYAVQNLQIMYGARHMSVRNPSTLIALDALRRIRKISTRDATTLAHNYRFLRRLIDALRIVRGNARDLVLPKRDYEEFIFLARRMDYGTRPWRAAAEQLQRDIARHMAETNKLFISRFPA